MDPFSIATTTLGLLGGCGKVTAYIFQYVQNCQAIDQHVEALGIEVDGLSQVLRNFHDAFSTSRSVHGGTEKEGGQWRIVKSSMENCQRTLDKLERLLEGVNKTETGGIFRRPVKKFKLDLKTPDIENFKQQIATYTRTVQLSLQLITV
jgi:hypothetical protein